MPDPLWGRALRYVLGALAVHGALALGYARTVGVAHDAVQMDARWLADAGAVDVMVAGDSHARFGVDASVLGSAINVAVPGEHYGKSRFRVPWLLDHGGRTVRAVVLPYDAASLSSFKATRYDPELVWGRYVDFAILGAEQDARLAYAGRALKARAVPYAGELPTVLQYVAGARHFRDRDGVGGLALHVAEPDAAVAARHFAGADPLDPRMVHALRELVAELRRRGIRVVLVRFPVTAGYRAGAAALGARTADRDALLTTLIAPGQVDHLDLEDLFDDRPRAFLDGDHLGPRGRRAFSGRLRHALVELGVLGPAAR